MTLLKNSLFKSARRSAQLCHLGQFLSKSLFKHPKFFFIFLFLDFYILSVMSFWDCFLELFRVCKLKLFAVGNELGKFFFFLLTTDVNDI